MVVYAHYRPFVSPDVSLLSFSFTGVDLFFVLSGFVFAPYLFGRPLALREFAVRRFFRIYSAYFLALGIYVGLKTLTSEDLPYVGQHLLFAHLQTREMAFFYNPAFWSLPAWRRGMADLTTPQELEGKSLAVSAGVCRLAGAGRCVCETGRQRH